MIELMCTNNIIKLPKYIQDSVHAVRLSIKSRIEIERVELEQFGIESAQF